MLKKVFQELKTQFETSVRKYFFIIVYPSTHTHPF